MTQLPFYFFVLALLAIPAEAKKLPSPAPSREALVKRINVACKEQLDGEYTNHREICDCVSSNLDTALSDDKELELMTRSHEEDDATEKELQNEKYNDILLTDYDITQSCFEHPEYKYKK